MKFLIIFKRIVCVTVVFIMFHTTSLNAMDSVESTKSYSNDSLNCMLQSAIGGFSGIVGVAMVMRGIFLSLNIPYPYSLDHNVVISINKQSDPEKLKQEEKENCKKGIMLSACGALMCIGGWFALSHNLNASNN